MKTDEYKFIKLKGEQYAFRVLANSIARDESSKTLAFTRVHKDGQLENYEMVSFDQIERIASGISAKTVEDHDEPIML